LAILNPDADIDVFRFRTDEDGIFRIVVDSPPKCRLALKVSSKNTSVLKEKESKTVGKQLVLTTQLTDGNLVSLYCTKVAGNLYKYPYRLNIISQAYWEN
jgi:hypothetical protein